jgi:hypothetical protein
VAIADFDCDRVPDLAVVNLSVAVDLTGSISVLLNRNLGPGVPDLFDFDQQYLVGRNPTATAAADFNADGAEDLAVVNHLDRSLSILLNAGCPLRVVLACRAAKQKAAGKAARGLLGCYARAAKQGAVADPLCLGKVRDKLRDAFAKAETAGECPTTQDAAAIGAQLDGLAADVAGNLPATPGDKDARKCAAAKQKAAGTAARGLLGCHARATKKSIPLDVGCLGQVRDKFEEAFTAAEGRGGCATSGDAAAVAAAVEAAVVDMVVDLRRSRTAERLSRTVLAAP